MISQNRLRVMAMKNDFLTTGNKYKEALKYYGYSANDNSILNKNKYSMPALKQSKTLSQQASLPRLPVPQLESSIDKYLQAVRPLLSEKELENTKKLATEFIKPGGLGELLQKKLVEKSKTTDNWLAQWWLDKIYLEPRYSLVINVNPGALYPHADYTSLDDQLIFATKYIFSFLDFKNFLDEQKLPTEKLGDASLCMDQYYKLIGTCRVPHKGKDILKIMQVYSIDLQKTNHITVMHNNKIFRLKVIDSKTGLSYSPSEILQSLKEIVELSKEEDKIGLGLLTAENRDNWAESYEKLCQNERNRQNFEAIQDSLFVLCLDTKRAVSDDESVDERSLASAQMVHGNKSFTSNRWFDKTIQVIIGANGVWGTNFEHSVAEAVPHVVLNDFVYKSMLSKNLEFENFAKGKSENIVEELKFVIPNEIQNHIEKFKSFIFSQIDNLDLYILQFEAFGKNFPKSQKVSPDAFVQIALQLAFYRAHGKIGNSYESGSLRKFQLGRTEIIRSSTAEAVEFLESMLNDGSIPNSDKADLLMKAINAHRSYTVRVLNCESFDRHLLGLKLIALENGIDLPDLYKDVAFQRACHYYISSSQVSSKFESVSAFGPAVDDGYGACYNITEKKILISLSSFKSCSTTNAKIFGGFIQNALLDCQNLLLKRTKSKL